MGELALTGTWFMFTLTCKSRVRIRDAITPYSISLSHENEILAPYKDLSHLLKNILLKLKNQSGIYGFH